MPDQGPPTARHVLFFAAVPPEDIKAQMASAWALHGSGESLRHDKLHLSLLSVVETPDLDPVLVTRARQAPGALRTAPFSLRLDRLMTYPNHPTNRPLVMVPDKAGPELNEIASDLRTYLYKAGLATSGSARVSPHVTMAYGPGFPEPRLLDTPIHWRIDEITLIDSHQGKGRHDILGQWKLPEGREQQGFDF